jgi:hypothetical protein
MQSSGPISIGQARNECSLNGTVNAGNDLLEKLAKVGNSQKYAWSYWYGKDILDTITEPLLTFSIDYYVDGVAQTSYNLKTGLCYIWPEWWIYSTYRNDPDATRLIQNIPNPLHSALGYNGPNFVNVNPSPFLFTVYDARGTTVNRIDGRCTTANAAFTVNVPYIKSIDSYKQVTVTYKTYAAKDTTGHPQLPTKANNWTGIIKFRDLTYSQPHQNRHYVQIFIQLIP